MEVDSQVSPLTLDGVADTLDRGDVEGDECCRAVGDQDCAVLHVHVDLAGHDVLREVFRSLVGSKGVHALDLVLGIAALDITLVVPDLQLFFLFVEQFKLVVFPYFHLILFLLLINRLRPQTRRCKLRNTLLHDLLASLRTGLAIVVFVVLI